MATLAFESSGGRFALLYCNNSIQQKASRKAAKIKYKRGKDFATQRFVCAFA